MLEPRVLAGCDEAVDLVFQRRDPGGIVLVDLPREVDEGLLVLLRGDGTDGDAAAAHARWLAAVARARQLRSLRGHDAATISVQRPGSATTYDRHRDPRAHERRCPTAARTRAQGRCGDAQGRGQADARPQCAEVVDLLGGHARFGAARLCQPVWGDVRAGNVACRWLRSDRGAGALPRRVVYS